MGLEEAIEQCRFQSAIDPGIYGIIYRLWFLPFVDVTDDCCSGHASGFDKNGNWKQRSTTRLFVDRSIEDGYLTIEYKLDSRKNRADAKKFHTKLLNIISKRRVKGVTYRISIHADGIYHGWWKPDYHKRDWDLPEASYDNTRKSVNVGYFMDLVISDDKKPNGIAILRSIRDFWQQVSDLIGEFEDKPIKERLATDFFRKNGRGKYLLLPPHADERLRSIYMLREPEETNPPRTIQSS